MRTRTKNKRHFRALCVIVLSLALLFTGCTRDKLDEFGPGQATGKMVMVSLQVSVPPVTSPTSMNGTVETKTFSRKGGDSGTPFTVVLEKEQEKVSVPTRASDGTTNLKNLWLFQFDESGAINAQPYKISDAVVGINDMVTIDVPLMVAENQTLYLLALGPKLDYDMSDVSSLSNLEERSFEYLVNVEGHTESLITTDNEVPFAGKVSGVTVVDLDDGNRGLVEYNKPAGFTGGIQIRRLMARITLRYKFEVEDYKLQGLKLLNVNNTIRLTNPTQNPGTDTYATLEMNEPGSPDPNGFYSATWYVAQNRQGTVASIMSEDQRYHKVVNKVASGAAPELGTQVEAWAYLTRDAIQYAIYQMYIGNNNTNNFDVEPNHFYNLRTTINAEINSAKKDERVRTYTATQYVEFHASANMTTGGGASFDRFKYNDFGDKYDLDAAYEVRPIVVQTQGRTVEAGIYTDENCTQQPVSSGQTWLRLSSSSNYTEAYNNNKEPLGTHITAKTVLPTQVKFYLYNDEYVYGGDGNLVDTGENDKDGRRSLYIKVTTTTNSEEGTALQAWHIFRIDQRPAVYAGRFGGRKDINGSYTMGLVHDRGTYPKYLVDASSGGTEYGYDGIETAKNSYGTDDLDDGKTATVNLAENRGNLTWTGKIPVPQKDASGHVLLYQYQYPAATFSARACYDKNRDEDGNGKIEGDELKWYLPASNQMIGLYIGSLTNNISSGNTTTEDGTGNAKRWNYGLNSYYKTDGGRRCVRDVDLPPDAE